jgi:anti-repressor protein
MLNLSISTQYNQQTINARDLHQQLEVNTRFNDWIMRRIENYGFVEDVDYYSPMSNTSGFLSNNQRTEYFLTLEMAKELALLENNPKGRIIRRQLIEAERQLREDVPALIRQLKQKNQRLRLFVCSAIPQFNDLRRYYDAGLTQKEMGLLMGKSDTAVREDLKKMAAIDLIAYKPNPRLISQVKRNQVTMEAQ